MTARRASRLWQRADGTWSERLIEPPARGRIMVDPLESAMALSAGMRLGPYEILGPVGAGGMGEVYRARDTRLGRDVAVKVLPGEVSHTPERLHRFEQEARLAGSLSHPNVLNVFDVGSHESAPYLVTELLEGRSHREMLSGRRVFTGGTAADTMTAILTKDPEELSRPGLVVPPSLDRIVRRCLEKDPAERFQSAKDVAFALEAESGTGQAASIVAPAGARRQWLRRVGLLTLVALAVATGAWFSRGLWERPLPRFTQLTFRRGTVLSARFTADGNTVVYSALWDGQPPQVFSRRLDRPESASLGLPPAKLLSVSSQGDLAILLTKLGPTPRRGP